MWEFKYLLEAESHVAILQLSGIVTVVLSALVPFLFSGRTAWRVFFSVLLVEYLFCTACMTIFFRRPTDVAHIELTPFWSYSEMFLEGGRKSVFEVVHNILFFIPFGALVPAVMGCRGWRRSLFFTILFGFILSVSIETTQYVTRLGFCETDDVIHNVAGCVVGWMVYWIVVNFIKK